MSKKLKSLLALGVTAASLYGAGAAQANYNYFCSHGTEPNSRCVETLRDFLHGVGVTLAIVDTPKNICVGAKTNSDGTGGNALPFRCETMSPGQTMWTPGGTSNWGYATIINQSNVFAWTSGDKNW